jgi:hypothetical protein
LLRLKQCLACDSMASLSGAYFLTGRHCKFRPNTVKVRTIDPLEMDKRRGFSREFATWEAAVRCTFSDRDLHSRMSLRFTPLLRLKRYHVTNDIPLGVHFLPVHTVNCVQTLKASCLEGFGYDASRVVRYLFCAMCRVSFAECHWDSHDRNTTEGKLVGRLIMNSCHQH